MSRVCFSQLMYIKLDGIETFAMAYLDDIMVFSRSSAAGVRPPEKAWPEAETIKMSVSKTGDKIPRSTQTRMGSILLGCYLRFK